MVRRGVLFSLLFLAGAAFAHAQSAPGGLALSMTPEYPAPGDTVHLSAASSQIDLERSGIAWYVNGTLTAEGAGKTGIDLTVGPLGSQIDIAAIAQAPDGTTASGGAFIRPAEVDLLWEADSYVPPFFRGRALPSPGTSIRAQAVARIAGPDGALLPESGIVYTWRRNGSVVRSASGRGKSSAVLPAPGRFSADTIAVNASSADGAFEGAASARIPSFEPSLTLYEDHPLFGVLYNDALAASASRSDSEATFAAIPLFAAASSPTDPRLVYAWSVNGKDVPTDSASPAEITISASGASDLAQIVLALTEAGNWSVDSNGAWSILFSSGGSPAADPFQTATQ